ncbi:MAG TPA: hypothetical protein VK138_14930 [Acidiferrobacterales bacterium]|nr:hypothetical protein [Acidiferrobacterales bacterium]
MKRMILQLLTLSLATFTPGAAYSDIKDKYRPSTQGYPQIIQGFDYQTIKAIESLFATLSKLGKDEVTFTVENMAIIFKSTNKEPRSLSVRISDEKSVSIGDAAYKERNTVVLFSTLLMVLADVSTNAKCTGVKYDQFSTRGYKRRTIIEFDCDTKVIAVDSLSNGRDDDERLYVLDLVGRKESFFWGQ